MASKLVRSGIFPSKGNKIAEFDYKSIEVRCAAIYTKDPVLMAEVTSFGADMHRDTSLDIWMLPQDEMTKDIRYLSKAFNFGQFYGASYKSSASVLWKDVHEKTSSGVSLKSHLKANGIETYNDFEEHCRKYTDHFWHKRFAVYQQWKDGINKSYQRSGYVENLFGFRFVGYMSDRAVSNYPIQSTAFMILLDSLIRINNIAKREKWRSKIIGQIHDSVLLDLYPSEEDHIIEVCNYEMSVKTKELYDWITVPLSIEVEITPKDRPWITKQEIKI